MVSQMQTPVIFGFIVLTGYLLNRWAESRISQKHYVILKSAGGEELDPLLLKKYYLLHLLIFPAAIAEQWIFAQSVFREMLLGGLFLIISGHLIRYWAINSLGNLWSMHCIGLPGLRPLNSGPYKYLNNPEYLSRVLDGVGIALLTGARLSAVLFIVINILTVRKINSLEQRQLAELGYEFPGKHQQPT